MQRSATIRVLLISALSLTAIWFVLLKVQDVVRFKKTAANLRTLMLAIERYSIDEPLGSYYPNTIEEVVRKGYLPSIPINPYSGKPMREIRPGDPASAGDFSYLPAKEEIAPGYWFAPNYLLVAYSDGGYRVSAGEFIHRVPDSSTLPWRYICVAFVSGIDCKYDPKVRNKLREERILSYLAELSPKERTAFKSAHAK